MSSSSNGVSRRSLMTATALASLAAMTGCGGGGDAAPIPSPPAPPPPPSAPPVTSKYLYTANNGSTSDGIGAFSIQSTGSLASSGSVLGVGTDPQWLGIHASGKWLYESADGALNCFAIDQTTGTLTLQPASSISIPAPLLTSDYNTFEFHPTLNLLYVADGASGNINTYSIDPTNGALTQVFIASVMTGHPNGENPLINIHPTGKFLYASYPASSRIYGYTLSSAGEATSLIGGAFIASSGMEQLAFNDSGTQVYGARGNVFASYSVNTTTGEFSTAIPTSSIAQFTLPRRIVKHPNGRFLFVDDDTQVSAYDIGSGGLLTFVGSAPTATLAIPTALAVNKPGTFLYAASSPGAPNDRIEVFSISTNGTLTALSSIASGENPVSIAIANL